MRRAAGILACGLALMGVAACAHPRGTRSAQDVRDVQVVSTPPKYCDKIGFVEGFAGNEQAARKKALEQAAARGATHARLDAAHPDLEDGMTIVVSATLFYCPPPDERFPPDGYP
ncbi:MAG: hypothetical protein ACN4G0_14800 [Polyangiales bacterium]